MYKDFVAGWAAGSTALVIGHPLDTVKTRLQTINGYNGIYDCIKRTFREESLLGLYKGLFFPFLASGGLSSLMFVGYGVGLKMLHPGDDHIQARKELPMSDIILASICGSLVRVGPALPVELIKTKLQVQQGRSGTAGSTYKGPFDCTRKIVRAEGIRGLFKGGTVFFVRENISYLFYIPPYEWMVRRFRINGMNETLSQMLAGGIAGVLCWWSICPLEVVKNRIQTDTTGLQTKFLPVAKQLWKEGGYKPFYRGGLTMAVRGFIVCSAVFLVYENILLALP